MALLYPSLAFFSTRIVVQRGLGPFGIGGMEGLQEFPWMDALPFGGLDERREDAVRPHSAVRSRPKWGTLGTLWPELKSIDMTISTSS